MQQTSSTDHRPNDLITLSRLFLDQLYTGTPASVLPWLHQDIIWTDTAAAQYFYGYYQVLCYLSRSPGPDKSEVRHLQYHIRALENGTALITGKYKTIQKKADRFGVCQSYQISLLWVACADSPRLMHLHISSTSPQTSSAGFISFHGKRAETYHLLPEEILYVEAENINCTVHTTSTPLAVRQSIGQVELLLPTQFLRIHRSFIINRHYVSRVYRYAVELSNHVVVPVPEKKYMHVVCEIERLGG